MKIYIVTDSSSYEKRAELIRDYYVERGHEVTLLVSDFNHMAKKKLDSSEIKSDRIYIEGRAYYKNISPARLYYHHDFANKVYRKLKELMLKAASEKTLLYMLIPGNSLAKIGVRLKKETGCKLIIDIIDLWPESLPVKRVEKTLPILYWKSIRDKNLKYADHIVVECKLYKRLLGLSDEKTSVVYWPKLEKVVLRDHSCETLACSEKDAAAVNIVYLGSINNIIDIPRITALLSAINEKHPVKLSVIGDGENKESFLSTVKGIGIDLKYYGAVYDEEKKQKLLQGCEWGLNIMKPTVKVGLTMKSVDYIANGLKLINSIEGDTAEFVDKYKLGVNVCGYDVVSDGGKLTLDGFEEVTDAIINYEGADRKTIHKFYEDNFSVEAMQRQLDAYMMYLQ